MAELSPDCIFCKIIEGEASSRKIYEDEEVLAILDIVPRFAEGQCLVIPKRHVEYFYDLNDDELARLFKVVKFVANKIEQAFGRGNVAMLARGRTVSHAHIVLFPSTGEGVLDKFMDSMRAYRIYLTEKSSDDELNLMWEKIRGVVSEERTK
jgi:histidine triad (HIT) family protein